MTRILLRSPKDPFHVMTVPEVLQRSVIGGNAGNLLFSTAVHKFLLTEGTEIVPNRLRAEPDEAARINDEFDLFVIPLANAFRLNLEPYLDRLARLVERLTIPVVIFGVGVQTDLGYDLGRLRRIDGTVTRLVRAVLERSASVGVRGECTADYLRSLGFPERVVDVIGCPSMFLHGDRLQVVRKTPRLTEESRIAVSATTHSALDPKLGRLLRTAHERYPHLLYVMQSHRDLELLYWGDTSQAAGRTSDSPVYRSHPLHQEGKARLFLDPARWIDTLADYDFAFGTRIHGGIAALLAGTPATVLCHDARTFELCRYFAIPHRTLPQVPDDLDPAELYQEADLGPLLRGHRERFDRLVAFMDRNGLPHVFGEGGDRGAAFEARERRTPYPPGVTAWDGTADADLGHRLAWLKEQSTRLRDRHQATDRRVEELLRRLEGMERRMAALERQLHQVSAGSPRPPRLVGRPLSRIQRRVRH